jgi:hypothetical protein
MSSVPHPHDVPHEYTASIPRHFLLFLALAALFLLYLPTHGVDATPHGSVRATPPATFLPSAPQLRPSCPAALPLGPVLMRSKEEPGGGGNYDLGVNARVFAFRNVVSYQSTLPTLPDLQYYSHITLARCGGEGAIYFTWAAPGWGRASLEDPHDAARPTKVFYFVQSPHDESLGHWVYEGAMHLRHWDALLKRHPTLQLAVRARSNAKSWGVKELFFRAFGIPEDRIVELDAWSPSALTFPANESNLILQPLHTYCVGANIPELRVGILALEHRLLANAGLPFRETCASRPTGLLVLPRHSLRGVDFEDVIAPQFITWAVHTHDARVLDTRNVSTLEDQATALAGARVLVTTVGSGLEFGMQLARGASIIATNPKGQTWFGGAGFENEMYALAMRYNRFFFTNDEAEMRDLVSRAMAAPLLPCPLEVTEQRRHFPLPTFVDGKVIMPSLDSYADQHP